MIMEILAWLTVIGIPLIISLISLYGIKWAIETKAGTRDKEYSPSPLKEMKVESNIPEWTSIDEESFLQDEPEVDCRKIVDAGTRVWRIYRSVDRIHWAECDPALTERAACNYADYIKRSNPGEFVRCDDPNGVILFYE